MPILLGFWASALLVQVLNKARTATHYYGPLRAWIAEDGISLRGEATETRIGWEHYIGYLEDSHIYLLYHNPRVYRIFPKRIFDERHRYWVSFRLGDHTSRSSPTRGGVTPNESGWPLVLVAGQAQSPLVSSSPFTLIA